MLEERVYVQRQPGLHILSALFVSVLIIIAALWMMGVITVAHAQGGPVVITVDFTKAEQASEKAVEKTGQALENAGEKLRQKAHEPAAAVPASEPPSGQAP
jgi:dissimilatory sulfite reductase (desulfoviridin) alpha/beta subunit